MAAGLSCVLAMMRDHNKGMKFVGCGDGKVLSGPTVGANVPVKNSKSDEIRIRTLRTQSKTRISQVGMRQIVA